MVQYYSTITKELYKTENELHDAEEKLRKQKDKKAAAIAELDEAYKNFADAYATLIALEEEFIKSYGRTAYLKWINS